jgi:hypothetical protein
MTDVVANAKGSTPKQPRPTSSPGLASELPNLEFPMLFRDLSEKSAEFGKENWRIMKPAVEKLTEMLHDTSSTTVKESVDYGMKVMEAARTMASAAVDLANGLGAAKTPSEFVELSSSHARRQLDLIVEQSRQLWVAAQRVTATIEPLNNIYAKEPERRNEKAA